MKLWLYESWYSEQEQRIDELRTQSVLIGSFFNPEAARDIMKRDNPDYASTDEDWEETGKQIHDEALKDLQKGGRRRKRRKVLNG